MVACNKEKEKEKEKNVTGVTLEPTTLTLAVEETATLTATVQPADAINQAVGWTSSHPEVATVSDGLVTAKSAGTATITVTTQEGGFTAECMVTVIQTEPEELGMVIILATALTDSFCPPPDTAVVLPAKWLSVLSIAKRWAAAIGAVVWMTTTRAYWVSAILEVWAA